MSGYVWDANEFAELLIRKSYPERTDKESALIRDYLRNHLGEYDRIEFSVRVGQGAPLVGELLPNVQRAITLSTQKRIDVVGRRGNTITLIEAKTHISHEVLGQLLTDRHLWLEDHPDDPEPRLVAIGRDANQDALRALGAQGIDVFTYTAEAAATGSGGSSV